MARPNQARLNLAALRNNFGLVRQLAPRSRVIAVVKANAYGHGALTIARELDSLADALAVACIEEAEELRDGGINAPILLLEGLFEAAELALAAERDFWVTIDNERQLEWVEQASLARPIRCLLKLDTGMHRLGVMPEQAGIFYRRLRASANARDDIVLSTHFASADDMGSDQTRAQLALFEEACRDLPGERSAANSAGRTGLARKPPGMGQTGLHALRQLTDGRGTRDRRRPATGDDPELGGDITAQCTHR